MTVTHTRRTRPTMTSVTSLSIYREPRKFKIMSKPNANVNEQMAGIIKYTGLFLNLVNYAYTSG